MAKKAKKEKKGVTFWHIIAGVALVIVLGVGAVCAGFSSRNEEGKYFGNPNLSTWHWADNAPAGEGGDEQNGGNIDSGDNGGNSSDNSVSSGNSLITESANNGISLFSFVMPRSAYEANGISSQADSSYTLIAEYSPVGATDIFKWTISGNEDEAITLTPLGMSATVTCNKAFDVQKVISITSTSNSAVNASCTVDYYKRLESVSASVPEIVTLNNGITDVPVSLVPKYGKGTILDTTVILGTISMKTTYEGNGFGMNGFASSNGMEAIPTSTVTGVSGSNTISLLMSPTEKSSFFTLRKGANIPDIYAAYFKKFISWCDLNSGYNHFEISASWYATRTGHGTIDSGTAKVQGKFDASNLVVNANDVTMSDSNILF